MEITVFFGMTREWRRGNRRKFLVVFKHSVQSSKGSGRFLRPPKHSR